MQSRNRSAGRNRDLSREPENCASPKPLGSYSVQFIHKKQKTNKHNICSKLQEELITQKCQRSSQSQRFAVIDLTLLVWGKGFL